MLSITLRQLRNTKRLLAWLRAGKTVELHDRDRVIAHIVPVQGDNGPNAQDSSGGNPGRKQTGDLGKFSGAWIAFLCSTIVRLMRLSVRQRRSATLRGPCSDLLFTFRMHTILRARTQGGTILDV
jgi:antitoxin (DNA-binding transcriptional repressor) of toxin-antitoxin stability system